LLNLFGYHSFAFKVGGWMAIEFIGDSVQYFGSTNRYSWRQKSGLSSVDSKQFCQSLLRPLFYKTHTVSFPYDNNSTAYYKNTGCIKKNWTDLKLIALNFAKQLLVSSFWYIWLLWVLKKFREHKFCKPGGGCVFWQTKNGLRTRFKSYNRILS
jgi:hypothetical protein